jgi:hypothetical protein
MINFLNTIAARLLVLMCVVPTPLTAPLGTPQVPVIKPNPRYRFDSERGWVYAHKAMERNKYAPWGRGVAGGAAV